MSRWERFWHWLGWHYYGEWSSETKATGYNILGKNADFLIQTRICKICNLVDRRNI